MRSSMTRALLCIVLCCSSVFAAENRRGTVGLQDLARMMQEVKSVRGSMALVCEAVSLHYAPVPTPKSSMVFLLARTLGGVLHRPAFMPTPAWALKLALGEFSAELLSSRRAVPRRALASGYSFQHPELNGALQVILSREE